MSRIWLSSPDVGSLERDAIVRAFDSGWIAPTGPEVDAFERDVIALTGWHGAVALSSGTAGLHLALLQVGVGPGDVVLTSTFTFVATANAIRYCGAEPVFIDSETTSWNLSAELVTRAIADLHRQGRRPAAVVMVDLYGQCADVDAIVTACRPLGIPIIEDAAEALGATYRGRPAGTLGDIGVFSFNGNKIITTSGGGMLVTSSVDIAEHVRHLSTQAREPGVHYEHHEIGFNYRLSNLLAALGRAQLQRLPEFISRRREINEHYQAGLTDIESVSFMPHPDWSEWNGWLTCVVVESREKRDAIIAALADDNIESRPLWKPMHLQPVHAQFQSYLDGTSEDLFERGLCLPSSSALTDADVDRVIDRIRSQVP